MTIESTVWQILRKAYVRALTDNKGGKLTTPQIADLLDRWDSHIESDLEAIMMAVDRARDQGIGELFGVLREREMAGDKEILSIADMLNERRRNGKR